MNTKREGFFRFVYQHCSSSMIAKYLLVNVDPRISQEEGGEITKKEGEACGQSTTGRDCGRCDEGLRCAPTHSPQIPLACGKCITKDVRIPCKRQPDCVRNPSGARYCCLATMTCTHFDDCTSKPEFIQS